MIFRKLRGVNLPYREQGLIWFTCVNYDKQKKPVRDKIDRMCRRYGGEHEKALFVFLTRENVSIPWIEQNYYVTARTLYRRRKDFYENWSREREGNDN